VHCVIVIFLHLFHRSNRDRHKAQYPPVFLLPRRSIFPSEISIDKARPIVFSAKSSFAARSLCLKRVAERVREGLYLLYGLCETTPIQPSKYISHDRRRQRLARSDGNEHSERQRTKGTKLIAILLRFIAAQEARPLSLQSSLSY